MRDFIGSDRSQPHVTHPELPGNDLGVVNLRHPQETLFYDRDNPEAYLQYFGETRRIGGYGAQPREYCPMCGGNVKCKHTDPLEEFCINSRCDYYRVEGQNEEVRR